LPFVGLLYCVIVLKIQIFRSSVRFWSDLYKVISFFETILILKRTWLTF